MTIVAASRTTIADELTGLLPLAIGTNELEPIGASASTQESRLLSWTVPTIAVAAVIVVPSSSGSNETAGGVVSLGSRTFRMMLAWPTRPSASVAVASSSVRPGAPATRLAWPWASRVIV